MTEVSSVIAFAQAVLLLACAPLVTGVIRKMKAMMQHRVGPGVLQPYRDLAKLFRKGEVVSDSSSWLFRFIPYACASAMILLAFMIPSVYAEVFAPYGDLIALVYIFTLYRFAMVLGGLEGGSAFGGMGSSREMMMSVLIEPSLLLSIMAVAALTGGGTDISGIPALLCAMGLSALGPTLILAAASFMITLVAENGRVPFDNPSTHLELTMVHEAMHLEYSGRGLALMEYASMLRLTLFMSMIGTLFFPWGIALTASPADLLGGLTAIAVKMLALAFVIALMESVKSKMRLFRIPNLLTVSFVLSLLAMISLYIL